jgi:16S rRNA (guanine966-N2)-methyltransferase
MRIIAGSARGRRLVPLPRHLPVRPTLDRVREAVFNILQPRMEGAVFLDLFAGTGANGLEALSRGAAECTFVEENPGALEIIRENTARLGFANARCLRGRLPGDLPALSPATIIYADPPHAWQDYAGLLGGLAEHRLLREGGIMAVEHASTADLPVTQGPFSRQRAAKYGRTTVSFYA